MIGDETRTDPARSEDAPEDGGSRWPTIGLPRRELLVSAGTLAFLPGVSASESASVDTGGSPASLTGGPSAAAAVPRAIDFDDGLGVVGTEPGDPSSTGAESVSLLRTDGSEVQPVATLHPDRAGTGFGAAVAVSGSTVAVGADFAEDERGVPTGSVAVFSHSGDRWVRHTRLTPPTLRGVERFGGALAASGDRILVGARGAYTGPHRRTGAAHLFERSGGAWESVATLVPDEPVEAAGRATALDEETAVVAARVDLEATGLAAVFTRSPPGWDQTGRLTPPDDRTDSRFGAAVAVDGDTVVVGAPDEDNENGSYAGGAYVFTRRGRGWRLSRRLLAPDGSAGDRFGSAVDVTGDLAIVGAAFGDSGTGRRTGVGLGSTTVFRLDTGRPTGVAIDRSVSSATQLGDAVAIDDTTALVTANRDRTDPTGLAAVIAL